MGAFMVAGPDYLLACGFSGFSESERFSVLVWRNQFHAKPVKLFQLKKITNQPSGDMWAIRLNGDAKTTIEFCPVKVSLT